MILGRDHLRNLLNVAGNISHNEYRHVRTIMINESIVRKQLLLSYKIL